MDGPMESRTSEIPQPVKSAGLADAPVAHSAEAHKKTTNNETVPFADRPVDLPNDSAGLLSSFQSLLDELETVRERLRRQTTELTEARELLASERARYRELFEVAPEGYAVTDLYGTINELNQSAAALINLPHDYLEGKPLAGYVAESERRDFRVYLHRARIGNPQQEFTTLLTHHKLAPLRVAVSLFAITDESGAVVSLRFLLRDVSASRADLVASRAPAAIVRAALDALSAHVAVLDANGRIVTVNRAWMDAERPAGIFALGSGTGDNYLDLCDAAVVQHGDAAAVARNAVESVLNGRRRRADVLLTLEPATGREGTDLPEWYAVRATRCDGPEPVHVVVTHEDTTAEQKALARERTLASERAARTAAEAASHAKSEFLATLSHELRTPLNAIAGYAQLMEMGVRGPVTLQQAEDLRRILRSERHLLGLINELLNFSRLERGDVPLDISTFSAVDAVSEVLELIEPQAAARRLTLTVHCDSNDLLVSADREKLRQILVNLLSNSLKFTGEGGSIRIECTMTDAHAFIRVLDTGIGIPAARLDDIFDPFVQVHRGWAGSSDGIGLGLAISRNLARAMGGDLTATSELGAGSSFELRLTRVTATATVS